MEGGHTERMFEALPRSDLIDAESSLSRDVPFVSVHRYWKYTAVTHTNREREREVNPAWLSRNHGRLD